MATGPLTPNMINAAVGILPTVTGNAYSLAIPQALIDAIDGYRPASGPVAVYETLYGNAGWSSDLFAYDEFKLIGVPGCLALTNATVDPEYYDLLNPPPITQVPGFRVRWFTDFVLYTARRDLCYRLIEKVDNVDVEDLTSPIRDLTKFAQLYGICAGYRSQANEMLNSMKNTKAIGLTFTSMEDLSTGSLSQVTTDFSKFGDDLINLGNLINLKFLDTQGYPSTLLRQILSTGGMLPGITSALVKYGVPVETVVNLSNPNFVVEPAVERQMYNALVTVTGDDLAQLCKLMDVKTVGLSTAADLLNPAKIFPTSYPMLRMQIPGGPQVLIYDNGSVGSDIAVYFESNDNYQLLSKIIPPTQALAMSAWIFSMNQVKNVKSSSFVKFAEMVKATENIGPARSQASPLADGTKDAIDKSLSGGTGPDNTVTIYDLLGTAAGYPHVENLTKISSIMSGIDFTELLAAYSAIKAYFNDPMSATKTLLELVTDAQTAANNVIQAYPDQIAQINSLWDAMIAQLLTENTNQTKAEVEYNELKLNSRPIGLAFVTSIPTYAKDKTFHGAAEFFEKIVDTSTLGGAGFLASLREARNEEALANAGIGTDARLNSD